MSKGLSKKTTKHESMILQPTAWPNRYILYLCTTIISFFVPQTCDRVQLRHPYPAPAEHQVHGAVLVVEDRGVDGVGLVDVAVGLRVEGAGDGLARVGPGEVGGGAGGARQPDALRVVPVHGGHWRVLLSAGAVVRMRTWVVEDGGGGEGGGPVGAVITGQLPRHPVRLGGQQALARLPVRLARAQGPGLQPAAAHQACF